MALSCGALWATVLAAEHPERVERIVYIGPAVSLAPQPPRARRRYAFDEPLDTDEGWAKYNSHYWRRDYPEFLEFFFAQVLQRAAIRPSRSRTAIGWALETTPETLVDATRGIALGGSTSVRASASRESAARRS